MQALLGKKIYEKREKLMSFYAHFPDLKER